MDFVILDEVLTALSFITPFILYGGMICVLSINKNSGLNDHQFHNRILRLKELLRCKCFLDRLHSVNHKPNNNLFHRINNHR
ncbi:hypothetical protein UFO1_2317 [Pelosinus sp. UFO1]|nr:hypothetical protein UFO1_2317 [Pelosinus sp. UFO1]